MIGFCPLASGSKGNSIVLSTKQTKVLIDAGLSGKMIKNRLAEINIDIKEIDAILITHEHADHIQGLKVLANRLGIPILANSETAKGIVKYLKATPKFKIFSTGEPFEFQDLQVHPFTVQHDTPDPVAFTIKIKDLKLGFCTDLGFASTLVKEKLKNCNYLYLEANHKPSMVQACPRPMTYKQRVLSKSGHLSNEACAELLTQVYNEELRHVFLAHLSEECNHPQIALATVQDALDSNKQKVELSIAFQNKISKTIQFDQ